MHGLASEGVGIAVPVCGAGWYGWVLWSKYGVLPMRIATHFGLDGTPNGWMSRPVFAAFSLLMLLVLLGSFGFAMTQTGMLPGLWKWEVLLPLTASLGLGVGAFLAILESASAGTAIRFSTMLWWMAGMVTAQAAVFAAWFALVKA